MRWSVREDHALALFPAQVLDSERLCIPNPTFPFLSLVLAALPHISLGFLVLSWIVAHVGCSCIMSGTNLVEHAQNGAAPHATSTSSEDYAASLRAAALMTLKAKRRKPATSQAEPILPHRAFAPADTIELDYGQEEPIAASSIASSPPVAPAKPPTPPSTSTGPMDVDHVQAREEGEISDSEMAPPTPKTKLEPMSPVLDKPPTPTSLNRLEPVIQPMTLAPDVAPEATSVLPHESVAPSSAAMLVDEYHVRPGLASE